MLNKVTTDVPKPKMATARFVIQMENNPGEPETDRDFGSLIPATSDHGRQVGDVTFRTHNGLAELGVDVEYGPELGALETQLQALLRQTIQQRSDLTVTASELFIDRDQIRDATQAELQDQHARLNAKSNDMELPLKYRRELWDKANQLRKYLGQ